ncbi:MAG: assimilatory sulfite reductase (NADPH) flavoprotein subunit [Xanthomonadales bacterium]|nr:assimilatory sulfite reductase (NADPH) flavoprotein subunit [Xanthomonadales bacterium]
MSAVFDTPIPQEHQQQLQALAQAWSANQQIWASGYLAGMAAAAGPSPAAAAVPAMEITVLYGSQTGNGQSVAESLAASAADQSLSARAVSMADYSPARLRKEKFLLVVVSTHGEGDPPDDAEDLWDFLGGEKLPDLSGLQYAVLALGDSSYANFCQTGHDFDQRLAAAGAVRLMDVVECDLDYQGDAGRWQEQAFAALKPLLQPVETHAPVLRAVPDQPRYTRETPFIAEITVNQKITGRDSDKDVRHLEISLEGSGISYQPGDSLAVIPHNAANLVEQALAATGLAGDQIVPVDGSDQTLVQALTRSRELTRLTRPVLESYTELTGNEALAGILESRERFAEFLDRYQVIDLLREFPHALDPAQLVEVLGPIAPRSYSIASAPALHDDEVHLTVALVSYQAFDRDHQGAASSHLAELQPGDTVSVFLDPNPRFRLPEDPTAPVIMIGPGTGVAPFRAFLQQREAVAAPGLNWLFFGDRRFHSDFLYQMDWLRWRKSGLLDRIDVAFSRDQENKVYVQHRIREQGAELFRQLQDGAFVYVCGDAEFMAPDVHQALLDVIAEHGDMDDEQAADYLKQLGRNGRYRRDVY